VVLHLCPAGDGATVLAELHANAARTSADPDSQRVLLTQTQPYANHNGGQLAFGPDGYLYLGLGDGGSGGVCACASSSFIGVSPSKTS